MAWHCIASCYMISSVNSAYGPNCSLIYLCFSCLFIRWSSLSPFYLSGLNTRRKWWV
jgi:hypothetical protein